MKGIPLVTGKYQNRNVLIGRTCLPLRMSKCDHRSVSNYNLLIFGGRICLVIQLLDQNRIASPTGWQEKREAELRIVVSERQTGWLVRGICRTAEQPAAQNKREAEDEFRFHGFLIVHWQSIQNRVKPNSDTNPAEQSRTANQEAKAQKPPLISKCHNPADQGNVHSQKPD